MATYFDLYELGWHRRQAALRAMTIAELNAALEIATGMVAATPNMGTTTLELELCRALERRA